MSKEKIKKYQNAHALLMSSYYQGVPGIFPIHGKKEGKTLAVFLCTHGNEPVGLETFLYFYEYFQYHILEKGTLLFILSNPLAVERYCLAHEEEKNTTRFVDINMNRLPQAAHRIASTAYEILRLQELYPVLCTVESALDLHSTSLPSDPMVISLSSTSKELLRRLPVRDIITQVEQVMGDIFLLSYVGGFRSSHVETVAVECGMHEDPRTLTHARASVFALMEYCGFGSYPSSLHVEKHVYPMHTQIFFPDESYQLVKDFGNFEVIADKQVLARGCGPDILAPHSGHALFAFKGGKVPSIKEAALFLTGKREIVQS